MEFLFVTGFFFYTFTRVNHQLKYKKIRSQQIEVAFQFYCVKITRLLFSPCEDITLINGENLDFHN